MGTFVGTSANGGNVLALTTANSAAITWPTVQAGDLAILAWTMQNTATPTDPTSQTFTLVGTVDDGSCRSRVLKRICAGTESGAISGWANSIQNRQTAVLFVVRGYSDIAAATSATEPGTSTTHDCPAIGTGNGALDGDSVIVIGTDRSGLTTTATPPAGWAKRTTSEFGLAASGGTYTGIADDGLSTGQTMPVDPAGWTMASGSTSVTWTLALRRNPTSLSLTAAGATVTNGSAAVTEALALSSSGSVSPTGSAALNQAAALSATGTVTNSGSGSLVVAAPLRATGGSVLDGQASLRQVLALSSSGSASAANSSASLTADLALASAGASILDGVAQLSSAISLSATGSSTADGEADLQLFSPITHRPNLGTTGRLVGVPLSTTRPNTGITSRP